jgi:hemoglobin/transferrin/lactoferrin receptor protein
MLEETMDNRSQTLWCARQGWVVILSLGLTGVACSLLGWAQDVRQASPGRTASEDASTFVFKELAVTATKTPRDPLTTPGEGNVISRDDIERTQAHSLEDVLRYQPGIDVQNGPRRIGELPVIRGLTGPRVLTTVDGMRLNFQSAHRGRLFVEPDALKQIEVVRGPNSALWGSGALGGVVALTTKDPGDYLEPGASYGGAIRFGYQGANNEYRWSPTLFGRSAFMEFLVSFTGRRAGDIRLGGDAGTLANSSEDIDSGLGKLIWHLSQFDDLTLSVQGFREDGRVPTNPGVTTTDPSAIVDRITRQFTYRVGYTRHNPDNPYVNLAAFFYYTPLDIEEKRLSDAQPAQTDYNTLGAELRNSSQFHLTPWHQHRVTYGLEWYRDAQNASQGTGTNTLFPNAEATNLALYLQDELTLWERIFLIPAFRWDRFENNPIGQKRVTDSKVSPKVGVVLKVTDFLYVETNYGEGFRAPNFGELFIAGTHFPGAVFVPNPDLKPEKSKNIDVGIRIRRDHLLFAQDRVLLRGAYFRNSLDDFIDFDARFDPQTRQLVFRPVNIQDARIQGYEAEMQWDFYPGFEFLANYTETRGDDQTNHQPLATIPPRKGVVGLSYLYAPWALTVGGRMQIVDDQNRVPQGTSRTGGYTVYDLYASWQPSLGLLKGLRVDFGIDNLTDKEYRRHLASLPEAGINPKASLSYTRSW